MTCSFVIRLTLPEHSRTNFFFQFLIGAALFCVCAAQNQQHTTPVPILKQINRHNEDGSYSYGYEGADGSFKIESKYPNGEVFGKYGYIDDTGKLREIEYGASRRGFEPAGNDINVAPPTVNQNNNAISPLGPNEEDDGQYREDPSVYYKNDAYSQPAPKQTYQQPQTYYKPQQTYDRDTFLNSDFFRSFNTQTNTAPRYNPPVQNYAPPAQNYAPVTQAPVRYNPVPQYNNNNYNNYNNYNPGPSFSGHPAQNVDIYSGSYSVNY